MSFVILKTFCNRLEKLGIAELKKDFFNEMIQYNLAKDGYRPNIYEYKGFERPPIIEIPEYRKKFNIKKLPGS